MKFMGTSKNIKEKKMKYNYKFEYKEIIAHRWNRMKKK